MKHAGGSRTLPTAEEVERVYGAVTDTAQTMSQIMRATGIRSDRVGTALRSLMLQKRVYYVGRNPVRWVLTRRVVE